MYGSTSLCQESACISGASANTFEVVFFSDAAVSFIICWALSWWMKASMVSAFSDTLCWRFPVASANALSLFWFWFCFSYHIKLFSFKLSSRALYSCHASILFVQDRTCLLLLPMSFITVNSHVISAVRVLSLMQFRNCSFSLLYISLYSHPIAFILSLPIHSSAD